MYDINDNSIFFTVGAKWKTTERPSSDCEYNYQKSLMKESMFLFNGPLVDMRYKGLP